MKVFDVIKKGVRKIARTLGKVCLIIMATVATVTQTAFNYKKDKNGHELNVSPEAVKIAADNPMFITTGLVIVGNIALAIWKNNPIISGIAGGISLVAMAALALVEKRKCKNEHEHERENKKDEHEHERENKKDEYEHEKEMKMLEYEHEKEMKMLELKANA